MNFRPITSHRAFEEIAAQIRAELAAGRLKVGSRLPSERALSEQLGVSRNTLRQALHSLEQSGLLHLRKGQRGGSFVTESSGKAVMTSFMDSFHLGSISPAQLTQARIWLESIVVPEACKRRTPEQIERLKRNISEAEEAARQGDFELRVDKHMEFHRILTEMTGNPIMIVVMDAVLSVLRHFVLSLPEFTNAHTIPSRRRFMVHFEAGDASAAAAEMEMALRRLERKYLSQVHAESSSIGARKADLPPRRTVRREVGVDQTS